MLKLKKILMPTDFSLNASQALRHSVVLADRFNGGITVLHVVALFNVDPNESENAFPELLEFYEILESQANDKMVDLREKLVHTALDCVAVRGFDPAREIVNYASEHDSDLIVMGTHGRSEIAHFLLGSVAERVMRQASCPVMTISHQEKWMFETPEFNKILVPIDFSEFSREAIPHAVEFAAKFNASIQFIHVVDQRLYPAFYVVGEGAVFETEPQLVEKSLKTINEFVSDSVADLPADACVVREGVPHTEIANYALAHEVDLIMMTTHGLTGIEKLLIGSTAEKVVRKAHCPVLSIKPDLYEG